MEGEQRVQGAQQERPHPHRDPAVKLQHALNHLFEDQGLLFEALTHRSFVNECSLAGVRDNERFEFLGDAVIDLVVSLLLMQRHPTAREGALSKMRASIVSEHALAKIAESLGVGEAMRLGRGEELSGGRNKPSLLADTFEALMAALYLEGGIEKVHDVIVRRLVMPDLDMADRGDPKTELQQRVQAVRRLTPSYRLVQESGPDHNKTFVVEILVGEDVLGQGKGRTKKEAEQQAAALALEHLDLDA
ncbi:MAG: ribonuclease III [Deltaproteobacteria bacterium]|nr:ribonuclease III [Deltaproteobacteria bacterium]